jgi:hypothetical protein
MALDASAVADRAGGGRVMSANRAALRRLWRTDRKARTALKTARDAEDYWVLDRARRSLETVLELPNVVVYVVPPAEPGRRYSTRGSKPPMN